MSIDWSKALCPNINKRKAAEEGHPYYCELYACGFNSMERFCQACPYMDEIKAFFTPQIMKILGGKNKIS